jgi:hypothetical protein
MYLGDAMVAQPRVQAADVDPVSLQYGDARGPAVRSCKGVPDEFPRHFPVPQSRGRAARVT